MVVRLGGKEREAAQGRRESRVDAKAALTGSAGVSGISLVVRGGKPSLIAAA